MLIGRSEAKLYSLALDSALNIYHQFQQHDKKDWKCFDLPGDSNSHPKRITYLFTILNVVLLHLYYYCTHQVLMPYSISCWHILHKKVNT